MCFLFFFPSEVPARVRSRCTLQVLARGEALMRREHWPFLHGHPASHTDQARLKVCERQRGEKEECGMCGGEGWKKKSGGGCNKEDREVGKEEGKGGEDGGMNDRDRGRERNEMHVIPRKHN